MLVLGSVVSGRVVDQTLGLWQIQKRKVILPMTPQTSGKDRKPGSGFSPSNFEKNKICQVFLLTSSENACQPLPGFFENWDGGKTRGSLRGRGHPFGGGASSQMVWPTF